MNSKNQGYDYLIRLILIGDSGVGKTSFLVRFSEDHFQSSTDEGQHIATIGIDFKIKRVSLDGKNIKLQIWDTAGQERFRTITQTYYKSANGIILAYDCTSKESFENVRNWLEQIKEHANPDVHKLLIATKDDKEGKVISEQ